MSQATTIPKAALAQYGGSRNADELFANQFVKLGLAAPGDTLPAGITGFNLTRTMRYIGQRELARQPELIEEGEDGSAAIRSTNWVEGWARYVEREFGHRNAFAVMAMWNDDFETFEREFAEDSLDDAETVAAKTATKLAEKVETKQVDAGVVQDATPILIDPDLMNTVRSAAPVLDWIDIVPQAGFTASYNVISAREDPSHGWVSESDARDVSGDSGSAFTLTNAETDMTIWLDLLDISDFSARATASLDFMDLEGTSMEIRMQEYATEMAEMVLYGNSDGGLSDGSAHDSNAPDGLWKIADDADSDYTVDKSGTDLSGDKALFTDIKSEILGLIKDSPVNPGNLGVVTSLDLFHELENEANVNVRIDAFDGGINFGRNPMGPPMLSIAGVPILPDPNVRDHTYSGTSGDADSTGDVGDVVLFDRANVQRRALQTLSSTPLGQLGLADRIALFQYEALISRSQGEHIRFLNAYDVDSL